MKKVLIYIGLIVAISGCEDIYSPHLENADNVVVVDAVILQGASENIIKLNESLGFNENVARYPAVNGASVALVDNENNEYDLPEISPGISKLILFLILSSSIS